MDKSVLASICVGLTVLAVFSGYRWRQRSRVRAIEEWVTRYLFTRFGGPLDEVNITCTDDRRWPVLASCRDPRTRIRHRLRFSCPGPSSTFELLSEVQECR